MSDDYSVCERQLTCDHTKHELYKQRHFDLLHGFELVYSRCVNCHKIVLLETKKLN